MGWVIALLLIAIAAAGALLVISRVDPERAAWFPKCLVTQTTGLYCPGCGTSRALHALTEGRVADADAICAQPNKPQSGGLIDNQWLFLQTLGLGNEANEAVRYLDEDDGLFALSGFLHYTHFDPRASPNLQARLEAQGIHRPPPDAIPFACQR